MPHSASAGSLRFCSHENSISAPLITVMNAVTAHSVGKLIRKFGLAKIGTARPPRRPSAGVRVLTAQCC